MLNTSRNTIRFIVEHGILFSSCVSPDVCGAARRGPGESGLVGEPSLVVWGPHGAHWRRELVQKSGRDGTELASYKTL